MLQLRLNASIGDTITFLSPLPQSVLGPCDWLLGSATIGGDQAMLLLVSRSSGYSYGLERSKGL